MRKQRITFYFDVSDDWTGEQIAQQLYAETHAILQSTNGGSIKNLTGSLQDAS